MSLSKQLTWRALVRSLTFLRHRIASRRVAPRRAAPRRVAWGRVASRRIHLGCIVMRVSLGDSLKKWSALYLCQEQARVFDRVFSLSPRWRGVAWRGVA